MSSGLKNFFAVLITIVVFWGKKLIVAPQMPDAFCMPLENAVQTLLCENHIVTIIINVFLLFFCAYYFVTLLLTHNVLPNRNFLASVLFLVMASVFINPARQTSVLIAILLQLFAVNYIFCTYKQNKAKAPIFISAFLIGISSMFVLSFIVSLFMLFVGVWLFNLLTPKHILSAIFGFVTSYLLVFLYYHLILHNTPLFFDTIENNVVQFAQIPQIPQITKYFGYFVAGITMLAVLQILLYVDKLVQRKTDVMFCIAFLVSCAFIFFLTKRTFGLPVLASIQAAYIVARQSNLHNGQMISLFDIFLILAFAFVCNYFSMEQILAFYHNVF